MGVGDPRAARVKARDPNGLRTAQACYHRSGCETSSGPGSPLWPCHWRRFLFLPPPAPSTPFFGSRATGMAGAATAAVEDGMALWINPAALAREPRADLELFGGAVASDRGEFLGQVADLAGTDLAAIAGNPSEILGLIAGLGGLTEPGTGVAGSGSAGLGFALSGFALGIDDTFYAGVYPNVDLDAHPAGQRSGDGHPIQRHVGALGRPPGARGAPRSLPGILSEDPAARRHAALRQRAHDLHEPERLRRGLRQPHLGCSKTL